jgi:hypothetical protein
MAARTAASDQGEALIAQGAKSHVTLIFTALARNLGFHMSPVFGQLRSCNRPKTGDFVKQSKPDWSVQVRPA